MTAPDAPTSGDTTAESTPEAPAYTSPTEQFQDAMARLGLNPTWGFKQLFEKLGKSASGGSGGRFEFSVGEMHQLHNQFSAEAHAFEQMRDRHRDASQQLRPLADDPASREHYKAARDHFGKVREAISQQLKFATGFRDAIGAAIGIREGQEDSVGRSMNDIKGNLA